MKKYFQLGELLLAFVLAIFIINYFFDERRQFENLDLGSETSTYYAQVGSNSIHISNATLTDFNKLVDGWRTRGQKPIVLVLGNSQTHAVNQLTTGQVNYPEILFKKMAPNFEPLTHSIPNANIQEFFLLYSFWTSQLPVKKVVIPIFIDDLREDGIRHVYTKMVTKSGFKLQDSSTLSKHLNSQLASFNSTSEEGIESDMKALEETVQQQSEKYLNAKLQANVSSWNNRETVRGSVFEIMYKLRNTVLQISPQTKRSLIPALKEKNLSALKAICMDAETKGIEVYVYIPPVRYDVSPPYHEEEYKATINEVQGIVLKYPNVRFKKLDKIVKGRYWGTKDPTAFFRGREYDFMHFQFAGHVTLADSLYSFIMTSR